MEFLMILSIILFIYVPLTYFFFFYKRPKNLPPGNMGLPYIGESLDFIKSALNGNPETFIFNRISKYSSRAFKTSLLMQPTIVVSGPDANKLLFSNENKLVKLWLPDTVKKIFPTSAKTSIHEIAKKIRGLQLNFLKPEALLTYITMMDCIARKHFESEWEGKKEVVVYPLAQRYTFLVACNVLLGIEDELEVAKFADPFEKSASGIFSFPIDFPGTPFNQAIKSGDELRMKHADVIVKRRVEVEEKRVKPMQDALSHMLSNGEELSEVHIADMIIALLIAGHDTASAVLTCIVMYLAEHPEVYEHVFQEQIKIARSKKDGEYLNGEDIQKMKYSWNVACEAMRIAPPIRGTFREAITDFNFSGFSIPKGWKLLWSTHSTQLSPEYFPEPQKFDPTWFDGNGPAPYTYHPFGEGPRMCPGKEYARLEILVFMHNLVKRFRWEKLVEEKIIQNPNSVPEKGFPARLVPHEI